MKKTILLTIFALSIYGFSFKVQGQNLDWVKQLGGNKNHEFGFSMVKDNMGNIYTCGQFSGTSDFDPGPGIYNISSEGGASGGTDVFISKLDASGNFIWAKQMGGKNHDKAVSTTVDKIGNVYTVGTFMDSGDFDPGAGTWMLNSEGYFDIFISKLDPSGKFKWVKQLGGKGFDYAFSIALDDSGNIYVTGSFSGTVDFDPGIGKRIFTATDAGLDIFIIKLDSTGNYLWTKQQGGPSDDWSNSIFLDKSRNIYTIGSFRGNADFDPGPMKYNLIPKGGADIFVSKLDASGNFIWAKQLGGVKEDWGSSIAVDDSGNVYTTGSFRLNGDFDPGINTYTLTSAGGDGDIFISKLNASGNFIWAKSMGGSDYDYASSIAIDESHNVYTTGLFSVLADFDPGIGTYNMASKGNRDIFISKLSSSGNFEWALNFGAPKHDESASIIVDEYNNIYTMGTFYDTIDFDPGVGFYNLTSTNSDIFVLKMNQSTLGIKQFEQNKVIVYPNPTQQLLNVDLRSEATIEIYSLLGVLLDKFPAKQKHIIDISSYPPGMYFLKTQNQTIKFIKQ